MNPQEPTPTHLEPGARATPGQLGALIVEAYRSLLLPLLLMESSVVIGCMVALTADVFPAWLPWTLFALAVLVPAAPALAAMIVWVRRRPISPGRGSVEDA